MGKIIIHACGGAGINVVGNLSEALVGLGDGFAKFEFNFIDTTTRNIDRFGDKFINRFYKIKPLQHGKKEIEGSGAERRNNASDIIENVKLYLDERNFQKQNTGEFHIVLASASGGSGSVVSPMLVKDLLSRNIPTIPILIGDSSSMLMGHNTLNTLATFTAISKQIKKPINLAYLNNSQMSGNDLLAKQENADKLIFNTLMQIALFVSGQNSDIDYQDMVGLFNPSVYQSFKIPVGLYGVTTQLGDIDIPEHCNPVLARTLIKEGALVNNNKGFIHYKFGEVINEHALELIGDKLPAHILTFSNYFQIEEKYIKDFLEKENAKLKALTSDGFEGTENSEEDESGLVF